MQHFSGMGQVAQISPAGYEKMAETDKKRRAEMTELMKHDLISVLYKLPDHLEPEADTESREQKNIFKNLDDFLAEGKYPYELRNHVTELVNDYGIAADENGFRRGFHMAMQICMEGMNIKT